MGLEGMKEDFASKIFGMTREEAWGNGICIECKEDWRNNTYTEAEEREYFISALCGKCFNKFANGDY